jgi:hypothetical protein
MAGFIGKRTEQKQESGILIRRDVNPSENQSQRGVLACPANIR